MYKNNPVICTKEIAIDQNMNKYNSDIEKGNIIVVNVKEDNVYTPYFWIMPSFFEEHYKNNELNGAIVYLGCCDGYKNDRLVKSFKNAGAECVIGNSETVYTWYNARMQDAFIYSLLCGDTVSEALNFAKSVWGYNDVLWAQKYLNVPVEANKPTAETLIYCGENFKLVNLRSTFNETPKISNQQAMEIGEEMYTNAYESYWGSLEDGTEIINGSDNIDYINITNMNTIKEKYTDKGFNQFLIANQIKQKDGKYYRPYGDRGSDFTYQGHELVVNKITENKIEMTSIEKYNEPQNQTRKYEFVIMKENGKWKIDEFTLPD